jgi:hypothetical protein
MMNDDVIGLAERKIGGTHKFSGQIEAVFQRVGRQLPGKFLALPLVHFIGLFVRFGGTGHYGKQAKPC